MIREYLRFAPLPVEHPAPPLSLTADEGTWIRLEDFRDHLHVLLAFLGDLEDEQAHRWLRDLNANRAQLEQLETAVFAVHHGRPEALRQLRQRLGLEFFLLSDPLALTARTFGCSRRLHLRCREATILVNKEGRVSLSSKGLASIDRILTVAAGLQGAPPPDAVHAAPAEDAGGEPETFARRPGKAQEVVREIPPAEALRMLEEPDTLYKLVDVRTRGEVESDRSPLATWIPVDEIPHRYQELGQTDYLIFICQTGARSAAAAEFMVSIGGTEIYNVVPGMMGWEGPRVSGPLEG